MGLCKCPKRQVTNQFCFEHRVNVCEHCMVQSHPKCIVQSYLQWLRDSDYIANCTLCGNSLEQGDCVRLICYHVFHWHCLNARQAALPANTTPIGHQCPSCDTQIFPTNNLVSPVADKLKTLLNTVNWGRDGLGSALLPDELLNSLKTTEPDGANFAETDSDAITNIHQHASTRPSVDQTNDGAYGGGQKSPHSVLLMDAFNSSAAADSHASSRRPLLPRQSPIGGSDYDDNKYRRRTPVELWSRWTRRLYAPQSRPPWRRTWFWVVSALLAFTFIIYVMSALGRSGIDEKAYDERWDNPNPNPNPNLHYD